MSRHINDHVPVGAAVALSSEQLASIESTIEGLLGPMCEGVADLLSRPAGPAPVAIADEQFKELKDLLQPGFELATLMLADYKVQRALVAADAGKDGPLAPAFEIPPEALDHHGTGDSQG